MNGKNLYMWNKLFKREIWDNVRLRDLHCLGDLDVLYDAIKKANKISFVDNVLYRYRPHNESITFTAMKRDDYYIHMTYSYQS